MPGNGVARGKLTAPGQTKAGNPERRAKGESAGTEGQGRSARTDRQRREAQRPQPSGRRRGAPSNVHTGGATAAGDTEPREPRDEEAHAERERVEARTRSTPAADGVAGERQGRRPEGTLSASARALTRSEGGLAPRERPISFPHMRFLVALAARGDGCSRLVARRRAELSRRRWSAAPRSRQPSCTR